MSRSGSSTGKPAGASPYELRLTRLKRAVEIAERSLGGAQAMPAKEKQAMVAWGRQLIAMASKPTSAKLRTVKSLEYLEEALLGYWNESSGAHVDAFWRALADRGIDFVRRDMVRDVLERRRIKSIHEYEAVTDAVGAGRRRRGAPTAEEVVELKRLIGEYQKKRAKQK